MLQILVYATVDVYMQAMSNFLPTPSKSHYLFNLRDFARVVQGILLIDAKSIPEGKEGGYKLIRLWVHEVYRVFYDRLVDDEDRSTFYGVIKVRLLLYFGKGVSSLLINAKSIPEDKEGGYKLI